MLGLPVGQHISLGVEIDGRTVSRSYTPTSHFNTQGHFELMIKVSMAQGNDTSSISCLAPC